MTQDILIWWLTAQALGLAGLPLTRFLFRALPDRGYAFSKTLGLLLTGYLAWLLAMLGLAPFGRALLIFCALAVAVLGLLVIRNQKTGQKEQESPKTSQFSILNSQFSIPANWRLILAYEAIFALALVGLALLRSYDYQILVGPNPYGTERPMDYAFFNAIRSSAAFPPHDPWMSGYSINYYYFGYLLMAVVSLLSGVAWGAAYNLSLALVFALTALGVAGIIWNLIALTRSRGAADSGSLRWSSVAGRMAVALLAVVLVLLAGNQGGALQVISGSDMVLALDGTNMARAVANGLGARQPLPLDPPFKGQDYDGVAEITPADRVKDFNWWNPSRALWDAYRDPNDPAAQPSRRYNITEFPFFSFWLGDMHPHVMALPFGLLALALALQTLARPAAPTFALGRRGWADLALTGIVLGSLYAINSWDLPTYLLLFLGALLLLYVRLGKRDAALGETGSSPIAPRPSPIAGIWWRHYASQALMALFAAFVLFAPFYMTFRSLVGSKEPLINLPILGALTRTVGFVTWSKTPLQNFLIIFGLFLLPLVAFALAQGRRSGSAATLGIAHSPARPFVLGDSLPWVTLGALLIGLVAGFPLLALLPLAVYIVRLAVERADQPAAAFGLWAFALGCLICFGTELVYIRDVFESRMNTIFKFYYQVWLIWGVLAGYALWWLFAGRWARGERPGATDQGKRLSIVYRLSSIVVAALFCALLAGALVYPWLTTSKAVREGTFAGIDGITPREKTPESAAAIGWLRTSVPGDAVVLEAVGGSYDNGYSGLGFGQVSGSTGLATVLGWPGHEQQWRGGDPAANAQIAPRQADVTTIYSSTDVLRARELLSKYGVDYIFVGAAERATYSPEGIAKLPQLGDVVFPQGDAPPSGEVVIYKVKK